MRTEVAELVERLRAERIDVSDDADRATALRALSAVTIEVTGRNHPVWVAMTAAGRIDDLWIPPAEMERRDEASLAEAITTVVKRAETIVFEALAELRKER